MRLWSNTPGKKPLGYAQVQLFFNIIRPQTLVRRVRIARLAAAGGHAEHALGVCDLISAVLYIWEEDMNADQRRSVERLVLEHIQNGGALFQVSTRFSAEAQVPAAEVEMVVSPHVLVERGPA